ncbi:site-specific integrase [Marinobacter salarius]|uniref:Uncharacterized protein n=1 Tax=Marinobacter salarius TaxID=1420917 RepID=A0A1W6KFU4_9GAMM|nr:site-specific integrase [Marinobacter salarius]ARM86199.1 hypothetical protein MARSALSMR5_04179 [Marinobacter salarius]
MIGKIETGFDTDNPECFNKTGGVPDRTRSLFNRFVREQLSEYLMSDKDVQQAFGDWVENHLGRGSASKKTKRNDLKDIRRFAERNKLHFLNTRVDSLILETRNNVPNKRRNFAMSHLFTQDTLDRILNYFETTRHTDTQYQAIRLFVMTCQTGLRTVEWEDVELITPPCAPLSGESREQPYLKVQTAKSRYDEPKVRYLILDGFSESQIENLADTISYAQSISKGTRSNLVIQARRVLQQIYVDNPEAIELLAEVDFRTARKLYTVELRRGGASMKEAAAALGHTSINNVRYYSHGDISIDRTTELPLARAPKGVIAEIKDSLAELNEARRLKGQKAIRGYEDDNAVKPTERPNDGSAPSTDKGEEEDSSLGRKFVDRL